MISRTCLVPALGCAMLLHLPLDAQSAPRSLMLEQLTSQELRAALDGGYRTVLIFSGSIEASGPHLALGKHNMKVPVYARRIAERLGHTIVGPVISVAPNGQDLMRFPGTIALQPATFAALNEDVSRSLIQGGFRNIVLLGDHGSGQDVLRDVATRLNAEFSATGVRVFFSSDGYAKSRAEILAYAKARGLDADGHGGVWDTSELWAVDASAVRPRLMAAGTPAGGAVDSRGVSGDPKGSSAALGRVFAKIRVDNAVAEIRRMLAEGK